MSYLTRQERFVLYVITILLITGGLVKWYRTAHPIQSSVRQSTP